MGRTVFERYGGFAKVSQVVMSFYDKVLSSPVAAPYFTGIDMKVQIDHQTKFIASLLGGPASYTNEHLQRVHERLKITNEAFDEIVMLLRETLEDFDFEEADIRYVEDQFVSRKGHIVGRA